MQYVKLTSYQGWPVSGFRACVAVLVSLIMAVATLAQAGSLDPTFGNGGIVTEGAYSFEGVALQPDGKIVAASFLGFYPDFNIAVFRYNPDGSRDTTFDGDGRVTTDLEGRDAAHAVALQADGKILVGANSVTFSDTGSSFVVLRYNSNGSLDTTFDGDGKVITYIGGEDAAHSIAVQPDGKIIVAGRAQGTDGLQEWVVVRYNSNGSLDSSFGGDGIVTTDFNGQWDVANGVALQADGKLLVSGTGDGLFTVVRYNSDGSLDTSFDDDGKVTADGGSCRSVAVQPDGKIIAAGNSISALVLRRYTSHGSLDTAFGLNGSATISFQAVATATSVVLRPDGKIVVAGSAGWSEGVWDFGLLVARYNSNGSRDTTFGDDGIVTIGSTEANDYAGNGVAVDTLGRIVIAGRTPVYSAGVYRFLGTGGRSAFDYDGDGRSDVSVFRPSTGLWYLLRSTAGYTGMQWGEGTDKITPADYDGDGKTDVAVFRASNSTWYIFNSATQTFSTENWGQTGDLAVPADYDGDGRADVSVYRPSDATWYRKLSRDGFSSVNFGTAEDKPVPADWDGDGRADIGVFRPSSGIWYFLRTTAGFTGIQWGVGTDIQAPGDYDGDGKTDVAVFRPENGTWYLGMSTLGFASVAWGQSGDIPSAGDYDGDGKTDVAVFRPSNGHWYVLNSTAGIADYHFGESGDVPTESAFRH